MAEKKTYEGSCHCGNVRYEAKTDLGMMLTCNCSICRRTGAILTFVSPDDFTLKSGDDATTEYLFNKKIVHHLFCSTCGIRSWSHGTGPDGKKMIAVNVRCLDGIDLDSLTPMKFDGASR